MFKNLNTGAIGIRGYNLAQTLELAAKIGFGGIDFDIREAAQLANDKGIDHVRQLFAQHGLKPGAWGLPVAWREDSWQDDVKQLPELAAVAQALGALRTTTWCPPSSAEQPFAENFNWHVERYGGIAEALKPYGIRFGIEFIGPQTLRPTNQHDFVYSMAGMLELIDAIGTGNVGLLLDAWHLYTSGESLDDLDAISNDQVVNVHVNDAPEGLSMAEYDDHDRRLPMETEVMDLPGFMRKLVAMKYDGPVTAEPFSQRLNALDNPQEAAQITAGYMDKMWTAAGLA